MLKTRTKKVQLTEKYVKNFIENFDCIFLNLEDIDDKKMVTYKCKKNHENTKSFGQIRGLKDEICYTCREESRKNKNSEKDIEKFETSGLFSLVRIFHVQGTRKSPYKMVELKCKNNGHSREMHYGKFSEKTVCKECEKDRKNNSEILYCPACDTNKKLDEFNNCKTNKHRQGKDHNCKKCREKQSFFRKIDKDKKKPHEHVVYDKITFKKCTRCTYWKTFGEYATDNAKKDKLNTFCKICKKVHDKNKNSTLEDYMRASKTIGVKPKPKIKSKKPEQKIKEEPKKKRKSTPRNGVCQECNKEFTDLNKHLANVHDIGVEWKTCEHCDFKCKDISSLYRHLANVHNIDIIWYPCEQKNCDFKCKDSSSLTRHLANVHDINVTWHNCDEKDCDFKSKDNQVVDRHLANIHDIGVTWYHCFVGDCGFKAKQKGSLTVHLENIHDIDATIHNCEHCDFECKNKSHLLRHMTNIHNINVNWKECEYCDYKCKQGSDLKKHVSNIHDIGDHECGFCLRNRNSSIVYRDTEGSHNICRDCFKKVTGKESRVEEIWSDYLDENFGKEFLTSSDKRVYGEKCQLYRPDKLYASPKMIIHKECDEHQHRYNNGSYTCDEKRISDIYDEFKTKHSYVVTRWNPHNYKVPEGKKKLDRNSRLKLDLYVTEELRKITKKIASYIYHLHVL